MDFTDMIMMRGRSRRSRSPSSRSRSRSRSPPTYSSTYVGRSRRRERSRTPPRGGLPWMAHRPLRGENGTVEYSATQVNDPVVALFFALVRNIPDERIIELFDSCISYAVRNPRAGASVVADLFVLTFQTRDCRGGKGERELFYKLLLKLNLSFPDTVKQLIPLTSEFGYYKDYIQLLERLASGGRSTDDSTIVSLKECIINTVAKQLLADSAALDGEQKSISLCAKYAPREKGHFHKACKAEFAALLKALFPEADENKRKGLYRHLVAKLTKALDVAEVKMCEKKFSDIDFSKVPSLCMKKYSQAFLNEKVRERLSSEQMESGNRCPDDPDRVQARSNLRATLKEKGVHGSQLFPHEIVKEFMTGRSNLSTLQKEVLESQWVSVRENIVNKLNERMALLASQTTDDMKKEDTNAVNLGKLVPLVDVSGSMEGTPMEVAIALGILISEVNSPDFRNRMITFHSNPSWVSFSKCASLQEKVALAQHSPWGTSTNIEKAFALIESVIRQGKLNESDIPDLIIFSDMQFDEAMGRRNSQTQLERIRQRFHDLGMELHGKPFPAPRIIFWNLRGDTHGFPATSSSENVQMLSGYSPSLFKAVVEGGQLDEGIVEEVVDHITGEKVLKKKSVTPYDTLRKILDDERYFPIREILHASKEKMLAGYTFVKPESPSSPTNGTEEGGDRPAKKARVGGASPRGRVASARGKPARGRGMGRGGRR